MITITKHYTIRNGHILPSLDLLLSEAGYIEQTELIKSAATKVSEYKIFAHTYDNMNSLKLRGFSLNELEVELDIKTKDIRSIVLRDTSVHKKITFSDKGAILTAVRGKDVVGENSEFSDITTKEPISKININGEDFVIPFELPDVYQRLTGDNINMLTDDDLEDEQFNANLWTELKNQIEEITE